MTNWLSTLWTDQPAPPTPTPNIGHAKVIQLGNALQNILKNVNTQLQIPRIVTVGGQSSGKTSVLNGLMSMDILPCGEHMVTRTPLCLELIQTQRNNAEKGTIDFGAYEAGAWVSKWKLSLDLPLPTTDQTHQINHRVTLETIQRAGQGQDVSSDEINVRMHSPFVPNLTLIDCPGLTELAKTDQGQPVNIKQKILDLVQHYVRDPNNIIIAVMPARVDLEADACLSMIKQFDPTGLRTVGVLTKVDLMEKNSTVYNYLVDNISTDLRLKHGYYAVKNRSSAECAGSTIVDGFQQEKRYFSSHPMYGKNKCRTRTGTTELSKGLAKLLLGSMMEVLPGIKKEIATLQERVFQELQLLGEGPPSGEENQTVLTNTYLSQFVQIFSKCLQQRGTTSNSGTKVKNSFIQLRQTLRDLAPFSQETLPEEALQALLDNCHGNHMAFTSASIELLETCLTDEENSPFQTVCDPAKTCLENIKKELLSLTNSILQQQPFNRFHLLTEHIIDTMETVVNANQAVCQQQIDTLVNMESAYIWTDDKIFTDNTDEAQTPTTVRKMLCLYFQCVVSHLQHTIPKAVMLCMVQKTQAELSTKLLQHTHPGLLKETTAQGDLRRELQQKHTQLKQAGQLLTQLRMI